VTEEKDGPVHYQVSVTGRQAAAFFLVLLAALGLSFFFGMRTGAAAKRGPDPVSALAAQSDIPVPAVVTGGEPGDKAVPVPTEVPIGFGPASPEPAKAPAARPAPSSSDREEGSQAPPQPPAPLKPSAEPEPRIVELPPPPKAGPSPATAKPAPAEAGPFWVQVFVTSYAQRADDLARKLKADGFNPEVSQVPGKPGQFRVRVGPYPDRAKAEAGAKKVEKLEKLETTIVAAGK